MDRTPLDRLALVLVIIGALNWLLVDCLTTTLWQICLVQHQLFQELYTL